MKLAILDLYDGTPNQGMRCIQDMVARYAEHWDAVTVYDVRGRAEVPDMSYDVFISTGGPGSPLEGDGVWDARYFEWLEAVWQWNAQAPQSRKKYVFFICHSFQMMVRHFELGTLSKRQSKSFGTFRAHKTPAGEQDPLLRDLPEPFCVADFRDYQVTQPNKAQFKAMGASIIALEKIRPHVTLERAIMGIRLSPEMVGVQFHPEADPAGMLVHFSGEAQQQQIITEHGQARYDKMLNDLQDPDKIPLTHDTILPAFLESAIAALSPAYV